jgi:hypothetical protein
MKTENELLKEYYNKYIKNEDDIPNFEDLYDCDLEHIKRTLGFMSFAAQYYKREVAFLMVEKFMHYFILICIVFFIAFLVVFLFKLY